MNFVETLDSLISLAEKQLVELDGQNRTLSQIEIDGDLPPSILNARVIKRLLEDS